MKCMRVFRELTRQYGKDLLLWSLVVVSVAVNLVLAFSAPEPARLCREAAILVDKYGKKITEDSISALEKEYNAVLLEANAVFQNAYGDTTSDLSTLYDTGCFASEVEYAKAVVLQQMIAYGQNAMNLEEHPGFFSVSTFSGARNILYRKILPMEVAEMAVIGVYLVLKVLESGTVFRMVPLEYSSGRGKKIDLIKVISAFVVASFAWMLLTACSMAAFSYAYPGAISMTTPLSAEVYPGATPVMQTSEFGYLALWLMTAYLTLCTVFFVVASIGLLIRNSFVGALVMLGLFLILVGIQFYQAENQPVWIHFLQWNPFALFCEYQKGSLVIRGEKWFLDLGDNSVISGNELTIAASWFIFAVMQFWLCLKRFLRKEWNT